MPADAPTAGAVIVTVMPCGVDWAASPHPVRMRTAARTGKNLRVFFMCLFYFVTTMLSQLFCPTCVGAAATVELEPHSILIVNVTLAPSLYVTGE